MNLKIFMYDFYVFKREQTVFYSKKYYKKYYKSHEFPYFLMVFMVCLNSGLWNIPIVILILFMHNGCCGGNMRKVNVVCGDVKNLSKKVEEKLIYCTVMLLS